MRRAAILSISIDWWIEKLDPSFIFGSSPIAHDEVRRLLKEYEVHDHSLIWLNRWAEKIEYNAVMFLFSSEEHLTYLPLCADGSRPMNVSVQELNEMCLRCPPMIPTALNCRCSLSPTTEKQIAPLRILPVKHGRIIERVES